MTAWITKSIYSLWTAGAAIVQIAAPTNAMDFTRSGDVVFADGEIRAGDAGKLISFLRQNGIQKEADERSYSIRLSSPGGNLFEGMAIGRAIRSAGLVAVVGRNRSCVSACALAFLGGIQVAVVSSAPRRILEYGADLGFHGFSAGNNKLVLLNETLDLNRVITALILKYAEEMKGVDLGWLSNALNVAASDMLFVRTPRDINALSISLRGMPARVPGDWYQNACRRVVGEFIPDLDAMGERVTSDSATILTIKALRTVIVEGRYGTERDGVATAIGTLGDSDAIDLVSGEPFYLDQRKPILDARIVRLERGSGFYFDQCIAVRSKGKVTVLLADPVGKRLITRNFYEEDEEGGELAVLPPDVDLW